MVLPWWKGGSFWSDFHETARNRCADTKCFNGNRQRLKYYTVLNYLINCAINFRKYIFKYKFRGPVLWKIRGSLMVMSALVTAVLLLVIFTTPSKSGFFLIFKTITLKFRWNMVFFCVSSNCLLYSTVYRIISEFNVWVDSRLSWSVY